jgi:Niemann-Pick C1 protein
VTELDQLISNEYGSGFYDSCKDVKFGVTNNNAMTYIGGGAKNYADFLGFLGKKSFVGSPFQINFPRPSNYPEDGMYGQDMKPKKCNDEDGDFRCACVDCPASCPKLPEITEAGSCHVGLLPCLSFGAILIYSVLMLLLATAIFGHIAYAKHTRRKSERLRLLQDAAPSDDEDEGDMVHNGAMYDRPQTNYWINSVCDGAFSRLGYTAAKFPAITIGVSILIVGLLSLGWIRFEIERDPARLWVSPTSAAAQEKSFFDESFGPFYRAEQVFLVNDTNPAGPGPVLSYETLAWWIDVEDRVSRLKGSNTKASLDDVCFKPTGDACVVQSVAAYFGNDIKTVTPTSWKERLRSCAASPVNCLPKSQQPIESTMILGGLNGTEDDVADASAIIVTWVVRNAAEGSPEVERAMDWEASLKDTLLQLQEEASERGLRLSFSTEISLEQELNKSTNTDAKIVVISYIIMFFYASLALGSTTLSLRSVLRNPATSLVESKFTLGVVGILIVLMSISASIGLFSAAGIKVTLIIAEVIPFIVLAVGVDNIFLIVHEFERVNISHPDDMVEFRIAKALGRMGPSILLSATTETIAFALGAFVGMPAVRNFAVYAAGAVFINAVLQVTMFVSVLALNQRRVEDQRADCFPCIQINSAGVQLGSSNGNGISRSYEGSDEGTLQQFIRKTYAPTLLGKKMKVVIMVIFLGIFTAGIALIPEVSLGLDQRVAIPDDSYLIPYFNDLYDYFESGPPVYFVTRELNVTERKHQVQLCSRFTACEQQSVTNVLEQERKRPDISYIANSAASWIDDYFRWLDPDLPCCIEDGEACFSNRVPEWNITLYGMPEGGEFIHYLQKWVASPTDQDCPLGGQAGYSDAVVIDAERDTIPASHFRASHTPLRSQEDFIAAYASARRISDGLSEKNGLEVFPYSVFYIFFDQYSTIVRLTATLLGSALALILAVSCLLLGSVKTGIVVTVTVTMIVVDIIGTMAVFNVSLNAVSLVNLVICVGIGVEFCAHIARAFMFPSRAVMERARDKFRDRDARAWTALVNVGGSVFTGITITKLLGVCVLAFTRSKIFEIYYFRIWLALVVFAAAHALIFLPVALSLVGGDGYIDPESDGGLEEDLASRRYRALLPDDESDSDDY